MGDKNPMGAVMTYNKIVLATLDNYTSTGTGNEAQDVERFQKAVEDAKNILSTGIRPEPTATATEETLVRSVHCFTRTHQTADVVKERVAPDNGMDEDNDKQIKREVYYSKVYKDGMVFPFLLQAIQIALMKSDGAKEVFPSVEHGAPLGQRLALTVAKNSFDWVQTKQSPTAKVSKEIPPEKAMNFYILGKLRKGRKAAVYLVCSTQGTVCAMKNDFVQVSSR
jgi:hypothetical protein